MAESKINGTAYSAVTSGITAGIRAYKFGRVAMLDFETCTLANDVAANTVFSSVSSAFYPAFSVSFLDSMQKKRIILDGTGRISSGGEALSAGVLRGVLTYITAS